MFSTVSGQRFSGSGLVDVGLAMGGVASRVAVYFASDGVLLSNVLTVDRVNSQGDRYRLFTHDFAVDNQQYVSFDGLWTLSHGDTVEADLAAGGTWTLEIVASKGS